MYDSMFGADPGNAHCRWSRRVERQGRCDRQNVMSFNSTVSFQKSYWLVFHATKRKVGIFIGFPLVIRDVKSAPHDA